MRAYAGVTNQTPWMTLYAHFNHAQCCRSYNRSAFGRWYSIAVRL